MADQPQPSADGLADSPSGRISVLEIARRLNIGRLAVYSMLEQGIIPGLPLSAGGGSSRGRRTWPGSARAAFAPALDLGAHQR